MKALRIYIVGPYSGCDTSEIDRNVSKAIDAAIKVFLKGHYPYVPHLTHFVKRRAEETKLELTWHDFIHWDMPWLEMCDAVLYLGKSSGADLELEHARRLGKLVFYSYDQIPNVRGSTGK